MSYSDQITTNVEILEARARTLEQQEIDRSRAIDQKTATLMAASLVLLGAGVAFASRLGDIDVGTGARTLWAVLIVIAMVALLATLGLASAAIRPQTIHTAIHIDELATWSTPRALDRDPTDVRGELMMASVDAVREARTANTYKSKNLHRAFLAFAGALAATLMLGAALAIRATEEQHNGQPRQAVTTPRGSGARHAPGASVGAPAGTRP
jgi:hypothetical protein